MSETPPSIHLMISYSRTDSPFVDRIEDDLRTRGYQVWVDRRKLEGGQQWNAEIQHAINDCDILLLVLSPDALASPHVQQEYRLALKRSKPVIPLRYYPTPTLPRELAHLQYVNFQAGVNFEETYAAGMRELAQALEAHTSAILAARVAAEQKRRRAEEAQARREAQQANASAGQLATAAARAVVTQPAVRLAGALALVLLVISSGVLFLSQAKERADRDTHAHALTATAGAGATQYAVAQQTLAPQETAQAVTATVVASRAAIAQAATATAFFISPYVAPVPGKCDEGGATWYTAENNGQWPGTTSCTTGSLVITGSAFVAFKGTPGRAGYSSAGIPPLHFSASVAASFGSSGSNGSPMIGGEFDAISYNFEIHPNGTWQLSVYNSAQYTGGNSGQTQAATTYTLAMTVQSGFVTFSVNGIQVDKMKLASGEGQATDAFIGNSSGGPVYCRNFVFTPLL